MPRSPSSAGAARNPAADWAANKRLTLPDYRGYALVGRDGMGNTAANRVAALVNLGDRTGAATDRADRGAVAERVQDRDTSTSAGLHGHPAFTSASTGGSVEHQRRR